MPATPARHHAALKLSWFLPAVLVGIIVSNVADGTVRAAAGLSVRQHRAVKPDRLQPLVPHPLMY